MNAIEKLSVIQKKAIKDYQCSGCMGGSDFECYKVHTAGFGCGEHRAGTLISFIGFIYLGMPKGFNRLGVFEKMIPRIFQSFDKAEGEYDVFNIPVWKYLSPEGHTFVRGIMPRRNEPFLDVYLENCMDKINCLEITEEIQNNMD